MDSKTLFMLIIGCGMATKINDFEGIIFDPPGPYTLMVQCRSDRVCFVAVVQNEKHHLLTVSPKASPGDFMQDAYWCVATLQNLVCVPGYTWETIKKVKSVIGNKYKDLVLLDIDVSKSDLDNSSSNSGSSHTFKNNW